MKTRQSLDKVNTFLDEHKKWLSTTSIVPARPTKTRDTAVSIGSRVTGCEFVFYVNKDDPDYKSNTKLLTAAMTASHSHDNKESDAVTRLLCPLVIVVVSPSSLKTPDITAILQAHTNYRLWCEYLVEQLVDTNDSLDSQEAACNATRERFTRGCFLRSPITHETLAVRILDILAEVFSHGLKINYDGKCASVAGDCYHGCTLFPDGEQYKALDAIFETWTPFHYGDWGPGFPLARYVSALYSWWKKDEYVRQARQLLSRLYEMGSKRAIGPTVIARVLWETDILPKELTEVRRFVLACYRFFETFSNLDFNPDSLARLPKIGEWAPVVFMAGVHPIGDVDANVIGLWENRRQFSGHIAEDTTAVDLHGVEITTATNGRPGTYRLPWSGAARSQKLDPKCACDRNNLKSLEHRVHFMADTVYIMYPFVCRVGGYMTHPEWVLNVTRGGLAGLGVDVPSYCDDDVTKLRNLWKRTDFLVESLLAWTCGVSLGECVSPRDCTAHSTWQWRSSCKIAEFYSMCYSGPLVMPPPDQMYSLDPPVMYRALEDETPTLASLVIKTECRAHSIRPEWFRSYAFSDIQTLILDMNANHGYLYPTASRGYGCLSHLQQLRVLYLTMPTVGHDSQIDESDVSDDDEVGRAEKVRRAHDLVPVVFECSDPHGRSTVFKNLESLELFFQYHVASDGYFIRPGVGDRYGVFRLPKAPILKHLHLNVTGWRVHGGAKSFLRSLVGYGKTLTQLQVVYTGDNLDDFRSMKALTGDDPRGGQMFMLEDGRRRPDEFPMLSSYYFECQSVFIPDSRAKTRLMKADISEIVVTGDCGQHHRRRHRWYEGSGLAVATGNHTVPEGVERTWCSTVRLGVSLESPLSAACVFLVSAFLQANEDSRQRDCIFTLLPHIVFAALEFDESHRDNDDDEEGVPVNTYGFVGIGRSFDIRYRALVRRVGPVKLADFVSGDAKSMSHISAAHMKAGLAAVSRRLMIAPYMRRLSTVSTRLRSGLVLGSRKPIKRKPARQAKSKQMHKEDDEMFGEADAMFDAS